MIGSTVGLVGAGVFGLSRLGRVAPTVLGSGDGGFDAAATAVEPARRIQPRRPFRRFPLDPLDGFCTVLSNFGDCRGSDCERRHQGIDVFGDFGQPIYAMAMGVLTEQYVDGGSGAGRSGNAWVLTEPDETYYFYAHLSAFADGLVEGSSVAAGQVIGYVGETGNSDDGNPETCNCHVHFEYHPAGGPAIDPLGVFDPPDGSVLF